jgi:hypothetical protein
MSCARHRQNNIEIRRFAAVSFVHELLLKKTTSAHWSGDQFRTVLRHPRQSCRTAALAIFSSSIDGRDRTPLPAIPATRLS